MEQKLKHLEFIQGVVNRLSTNSFLLKGWTVVIISALFVLGSTGEENKTFFYLAYFPGIIFWLLDGYYLWQERLYRHLYDDIRLLAEKTDFSMKTDTSKESYFKTVGSKTIAGFHVPLLLIIFLVLVLS